MSYQEAVATEVACRLLAAIPGMTRMKLMKLMYIIDRAALLRWGYAITGDEYVAIEHAPVLSQTYNNLRERPEDSSRERGCAQSAVRVRCVVGGGSRFGGRSDSQARPYDGQTATRSHAYVPGVVGSIA